MEFGAYLRGRRKAAGLSQRTLAERLGLSHTYVSKIENGAVRPPSARTLQKMAEVLMVNPEEFAGIGGKPAEAALRVALEQANVDRADLLHEVGMLSAEVAELRAELARRDEREALV